MTNVVCPWPRLTEPFATGKDSRGSPISVMVTEGWLRCLLALHIRTGSVSGAVTLLGVPGEMRMWAGTAASVPSGWLVCNGASILRASYPDLFAAIGTTWGAVDGAHFTLPDMRGSMPLGVGVHALASVGGSETTTIAVANLPAHSHGVTDPGHTHAFTGAAHNHGVTDAGHTHGVTDPGHAHGVTDPNHAHNASSGNFVRDNAGTEYLNTGGNKGDTGAATTSAATGVSVNGNTTGISTNNATTGATINNTTATGTNAANTTGITTTNTGGAVAATTVSPFVAVNFMIKT